MIEHCVGCDSHKWTTRHSAAKYESFAKQMQEQLGGESVCLINKLPGSWLESPTLVGLQLKEYPAANNPEHSIDGRMATFEIYANIGHPQGKLAIVHLFSKRLSGVWPHFSAVGSRAKRSL